MLVEASMVIRMLLNLNSGYVGGREGYNLQQRE